MASYLSGEDRLFTVIYANIKLDGYLKHITRDVVLFLVTNVQNVDSARRLITRCRRSDSPVDRRMAVPSSLRLPL